jgi:hypothetical protein
MTKITSLEQKTFQGKPSGFKVTLSDGRIGNLQEKESDKGLRVGDEVIVKEIPYTSKAGVASILLGLRLHTVGQTVTAPATATQFIHPQGITPLHMNNGANVNAGVKEEMKFKFRTILLPIALGFYKDGKFNNQEALENCAGWVSFADGLVDEIFK